MELIKETSMTYNGYTIVPADVFKHLGLDTPSESKGKKKRKIQWYKQGNKVIIKIVEE